MEKIKQALKELGIREVNYGACTGVQWLQTTGEKLTSFSPADGKAIADIVQATKQDYEAVMKQAKNAFLTWREVPAPKRGEIIRQIGLELRRYKEPLGMLVSWEMGKIYQEGLGEVQEMIDIADFAVGLSRQLYGLTMHSERPDHRMYEQYHPLGVVGVISAFNFPVAVWSWNAALAWVCGNAVLWKPSSKVPLTAVATTKIVDRVFRRHGFESVFNLVIGPS